jgi:hypothetical protein
MYLSVKEPLRRIILKAPNDARSRFRCTSHAAIDPEILKGVLSELRGIDMQSKLAELPPENLGSMSWILKEPEYRSWLEPVDATRDEYLWICGSEGNGKTTASVAAIRNIEERIMSAESEGSTRRPDLLAYFFCDPTTGCNTAEDLLKSVLRQLCKQHNVLAAYAKDSEGKLKEAKSDGPKVERKANLSVEKLWQYWRDMFTERSIDTIYIVINNLHNLPENEPSTKQFLSLIGGDIRNQWTEKQKRVSTNWLFTSRDREPIRDQIVEGPSARCINLASDKYGKNLKRDLHEHTWEQIDGLRQKKGLNKAISYFAGCIIANRAEGNKWVDVAVLRLAALPPRANDIHIRRLLEHAPQALPEFLDDAWKTVSIGRKKSARHTN